MERAGYAGKLWNLSDAVDSRGIKYLVFTFPHFSHIQHGITRGTERVGLERGGMGAIDEVDPE